MVTTILGISRKPHRLNNNLLILWCIEMDDTAMYKAPVISSYKPNCPRYQNNWLFMMDFAPGCYGLVRPGILVDLRLDVKLG